MTDRSRFTDVQSYKTYINVSVPTPPAFANDLNNSYKIYTTQSATFVVPDIVIVDFQISSVDVTATDLAFAQTLKIKKINDVKYELVYDGTYEAASAGTFTITITDEFSKTTDILRIHVFIQKISSPLFILSI